MTWRPIPKSIIVDARGLSLIANAAAPALGSALFQAASAIASFEEVFGFEVQPNHAPRAVGFAGLRADCGVRVTGYVESYHSLDPVLRELRRCPSPDSLLVRRLHAAEIRNAHYRWQCFDQPGFAEKISIAVPVAGSWAVTSFYRHDVSLGDSAIDAMVDFSVALARIREGRFAQPSASTRRSAEERLLTRLSARFPTLTAREKRVMALTLLGKDSRSIGETLGIAKPTVLTYRRRAYERLGITSANEVLDQILD